MKTETQCNESTCSTAIAPATERSAKPKYHVHQDDDSWKVSIEVPGVKREGVDVGFEDGILDIKAKRSDSVPETWRALDYVAELRNYRLKLELPESVDSDQISAKLEDGILRLTLPVSEALKPRSIKVE